VETSPEERRAELLRERRSQLRGLLWLALVVLIFLLVRARPLMLFHPGWWRF
jgi:hypothetical protein